MAHLPKYLEMLLLKKVLQNWRHRDDLISPSVLQWENIFPVILSVLGLMFATMDCKHFYG